jgi:hypothetical protein
VGNVVNVLVFFFLMGKNSGPFAENLRQAISSLALFNVLPVGTEEMTLPLRLVRFGGSTGVRHDMVAATEDVIFVMVVLAPKNREFDVGIST